MEDNCHYKENERPVSLLANVVEAAFYLVLMITIFPSQMGTAGRSLINGAAVTAVGLLTFCVIRIQKEKFPYTFYFILAFNIVANFSQVVGNGDIPLLGTGLPELIHWASFTLIISYLVRSRGAEQRVFFAYAVVIIMAVVVGGIVDPMEQRLNLEAVGGNFRNANDLAYTSGLFAVALLFTTLRTDTKTQVLSWFLAMTLMYFCLQTVSRGGMIALSMGVVLFLAGSVINKNWLRNTVVGGVIALLCVGIWGEQLSQSFDSLLERTNDRSYLKRANVYTADLLRDLGDTLVIGTGVDDSVTSGRITAHNSFLYTHIAYGGIAAYLYLVWVLWLARGVWIVIAARGVPPNIKLMVVAVFLMMLVSHAFSNRAYLFPSSIIAVAIIERYTNMLRRPFHSLVFSDIGYERASMKKS